MKTTYDIIPKLSKIECKLYKNCLTLFNILLLK